MTARKSQNNFQATRSCYASIQHHSKFLSILFNLASSFFVNKGWKPVFLFFSQKCLICLMLASSIIRFSSTRSCTWSYTTSSFLCATQYFSRLIVTLRAKSYVIHNICAVPGGDNDTIRQQQHNVHMWWAKQMFSQQKLGQRGNLFAANNWQIHFLLSLFYSLNSPWPYRVSFAEFNTSQHEIVSSPSFVQVVDFLCQGFHSNELNTMRKIDRFVSDHENVFFHLLCERCTQSWMRCIQEKSLEIVANTYIKRLHQAWGEFYHRIGAVPMLVKRCHRRHFHSDGFYEFFAQRNRLSWLLSRNFSSIQTSSKATAFW